ncbi:hypothetical protein FH972_021200 [Carpinus fangiana]|uniref:F-box domain-containing protein n=1 Tax=Carpinus fangiana TaxID=176857 RepID=A0A5N6KP15_9ROSI|nr:hypothetical protein FH972_021200 [Carpinus fangiana]
MTTNDALRVRRESRRSQVSPSPSAGFDDTDLDVSPPNLTFHDALAPTRKPSSSGTLGQLSYAPTTQTTVVTTTTTTTTSFPPIFVKPPRLLRFADQEDYPLAASPTPQSIKRIRFKIGGQDTYFEEAEDAETRLREFNERQARLKSNQGIIRTVKTEGALSHPRPRRSYQSSLQRDVEGEGLGRRDGDRNRSATPISLSDAAELQSFHRRNTKPRSSVGARLPQPGTQYADDDSDDNYEPRRALRQPLGLSASRNVSTESSATATDAPQDPAADVKVPPSTEESLSADSDANPFSNFKVPEARKRSVAPSNINTSPLHDASLPSPSLSPITAAANLRHETARRARLRDAESLSLPPPATRQSSVLLSPNDPAADVEDGADTPHPLVDIPNMLDSYDSMPDPMKTYIMYQMLRRSSKRTLHFVSEVIEPALKCDFLGRLPLELSLNITSRLDAKSMCRAAQVSKKWRNIIDSDERAWKNLIKQDGFVLADGEIERAVREGWGWQLTTGRNDADKDLRQLETTEDSSFTEELSRRLSEASVPGSHDSPHQLMSKRKRKFSNSDKGSKRQKRNRVSPGHQRSAEWLDSLEEASGPAAYANAACMAMPDPQVGLQSLRRMSLFKSIYRRHCCIMKGWMDPNSEPLHLAFKAHQRHVVTCLQFDSEKILTGSDDANIDIYDTSSGASLKTLRGHDGGVWALEYLGDILVSGSTDRTVRVWNMKTGKLLHIFQGHTSTVRCLQILRPTKIGETADGKPIVMPKQPLIITGSRDSTCRIWTLPEPQDRSYYGTVTDVDNPYFVRALTGHSNSVRAIAAHGDTLVSGSYDSTVRVWRLSDGECVHRLQGHTSKVYSVVLDHARNRCISGSMDSLVKVWSLETGACLFNLEGHTSLVGLLDLKDDCLVSAAADATLRIWEPENGRCHHTLSAHTAAITCFAHDKQKIISGSDRTLKMWNTETGDCVRDLLTDLGGVWQIKFDQRRCVAAVQRNRWTYIEVLDFGACRDGWGEGFRGRRIVVDHKGREIMEEEDAAPLEPPEAEF